MFAALLKLHSTFSRGKFTIPQLVDIYGAQGFGAVAITDQLIDPRSLRGKAALALHKSLKPAVLPIYREILRSEAKRARDQYGMVLIPGVEVFQRERILGLGIEDLTGVVEDFAGAARWIESNGGMVVPSPKVDTWRIGLSCERELGAILKAVGEQRFDFETGRNYESRYRNDLVGSRDGDHRASPGRNVVMSQALSSLPPSKAGTDSGSIGPWGVHLETAQRS